MNKKIAALVLGAVLTTGIGGFGTYAYFTDHQEVKDNVEVVFGTLKAEANWANTGFSQWTPESAHNEAKVDGTKLSNVKPGDKFHRDITVKNVGSLKADTAISLKESFRGDAFKVTMGVVKGNDAENVKYFGEGERYEEHAVAPGTEYTLRLTVEVNKDLGNDWQGTGGLFEAHDFVNVDLHQTINE